MILAGVRIAPPPPTPHTTITSAILGGFWETAGEVVKVIKNPMMVHNLYPDIGYIITFFL
jgi:hypothetical protein